MLPGESFAGADFLEGVIVGPMPGWFWGAAGFLVGVGGCVRGIGPATFCAGDWSVRLMLPGVPGNGKSADGRVGVTGTGACWDILHGESDAERGRAGKFEALGGVLRKGACISALVLRAMGPGIGIFLVAVLFSASAMMALISTLQKVNQCHSTYAN